MNKYITAAFVMAFSIVAAPAVPVYLAGRADTAPAETGHTAIPETGGSVLTAGSYEPYKVLDISSGQVFEVSVRDYVIGAVAAEMPATFSPEALKAQAVAAHTYAERQRQRERQSPSPELCGADLSNDTAHYQGWFTDEEMRQYYGENYEKYRSAVEAAADEVLPYIIVYNSEPIIAAFHSISSGRTESAENMWGTAVDYLVPADSEADRSAPTYTGEAAFTRDMLEQRIAASFEGVTLPEDFTRWVQVGQVSESGTVLTAVVGDMTVSGSSVREALGLRSAAFDVRYEGDEAIFTTRGFGHGVGMSQYGAEAMAKSGSTWREILCHYYKGCTITVVQEN